MEIKKTVEEEVCRIDLLGRLDTTTAPDLENELKEDLNEGLKDYVLDLKELEYISSAGLRVLLFIQKSVSSMEGSLLIRNVRPEIMEVFEITGFSDILTIE